jgi:hypothetical protein
MAKAPARLSPERARARGLTSTVTLPRGNLAPAGAAIRSTAIELVINMKRATALGLALAAPAGR